MIARATPSKFTSMGYGMYFFFMTTKVLSVPYVIYSLPETKNVPSEEVRRMFASGLRLQKANGAWVRGARAKNSTVVGS